MIESTLSHNVSVWLAVKVPIPLTVICAVDAAPVGAGTGTVTVAEPLMQGVLTVHLKTYVPCIRLLAVAL
jgi:hypothetical protein